jgi:hypothetical protein
MRFRYHIVLGTLLLGLSRTCGDNKILCFVGWVRCGDSFDNKLISFNPRRNPLLSVL